MTILLDAGHGIDTPGKRSPDGAFREYLWNRAIVDLVAEHLSSWDVRIVLVCPETNDIPLRTRAMRVNAVCKEDGTANCLLLSIHSNAAGNGKSWMSAKGWSCYTTKGQTASDDLAECLYMAFEAEFPDRKIRKDRTDGDSDYEENFYIIEKTSCKAVLLENFFYDNKEECDWLLRKETQSRIAVAIVDGLRIYLSRV